MKMHVDFDFTPEEARTFLGLPDLKPMQEAVMAQMQKQMLDAANAFSSPEAVLRTWLSLWPGSPDQMREMFARFFGGGRTTGGSA